VAYVLGEENLTKRFMCIVLYLLTEEMQQLIALRVTLHIIDKLANPARLSAS
jgi:hypothetical protein